MGLGSFDDGDGGWGRASFGGPIGKDLRGGVDGGLSDSLFYEREVKLEHAL